MACGSVFSVSELHNFSGQYRYLFKFRGLIRWYIVPYFLLKKSLLLPTNYEIRGLVGSQNGANIHMSVPKSLQYLPTNLYTSMVDFIFFWRLVESPLDSLYGCMLGDTVCAGLDLRSVPNM